MSIAADACSDESADECDVRTDEQIASDAEANAHQIPGVVGGAGLHDGDGETQANFAEPEANAIGSDKPAENSSEKMSGVPSSDDGVIDHQTYVDANSAPKLQDQRLASLISLVDEKKINDRELLDLVFNMLVGGSFDVESNFVITDVNKLFDLQQFIQSCPEKVKAEIWSMLNGLLRKSRLNQLACTEARFIEYIVLQLQNPTTSNLVADLLIDMLTILANYSIKVKELQVLLSYLKVPSGTASGARWPPYAHQILQALRHMPHRTFGDQYFCFSGASGTAISLPPISGPRWPYINGWTFCTWIYLDDAPNGSDAPSTPYIYCFQSKQEVGYTARIVGSSLVISCARAKGRVQQHRVQYDFQPRQWYMITVVHIYNRWKASSVKCYINMESVSTSDLPWAYTLPEQFDKCYIGGGANLDKEGAFCGQMSAVYLHNEALAPNVIEALYAAGPSYKGQFRFENECGSYLEDRHKKALFDGKLTASIVLMYSPSSCHSNICLESSPKGNATVFAHSPHAMLIGGAKAVSTRSIHAALHSLGGIQVIYPLFGQLDSVAPLATQTGEANVSFHNEAEMCNMLMGLVCDLVETSTTIQQQIAVSRGFLVIGHYLEKANPGNLSEDVLGCFIRLAKFFTSPASEEAPHCDTLLRQLHDYIFFNPALWINASVKVQMSLYHFLATQYLELATLFGSAARRVSTVIQVLNAFKYYYYLVNPTERSGIIPCGTEHARPVAEDLAKLRSVMLFFIDNLIGRYGGVIDDEMESMLNYLAVMNEVDNIYDVLCASVSFMDKYAASMVPAFDRKHGINAVFKLLASSSESVRVQALKLLAFFLARSTARRKHEAMLTHNLFTLIGDHLLLSSKFLSHNVYSCLMEILTENVNLHLIPVELRRRFDLSCRIENPAILKVIATLIKQSSPNKEVLEVRQLFLTDLLSLCENSPENRRSILQMSVWQDWLFSLAYIYPSDSFQEAVTADVLSIFRLLLFHAIRVEYGGWRVWIDTVAIVHARVSYEDFQINAAKLHRQQLQQISDHEKQRKLTSSGVTDEHSHEDLTAKIASAVSAADSVPAATAGDSSNCQHDDVCEDVKKDSATGDGHNVGRSAADGDRLLQEPLERRTSQPSVVSTGTRQRVTFTSAAPRSAPFRIPEFRWSHLHQYLLSDLLVTLDQDISSWKTKEDKAALREILSDPENSVYIMNTVNIVSHLSDVLITASGGLLPLLSAATSVSGHIDILEPGYGLTIQNAVAYLLRILEISDIMVMSSSIVLRDLEAEKSMNSGTILRQCLRIVSTAAVRSCLECRKASGYYGSQLIGNAAANESSSSAASAAISHPTSDTTPVQPTQVQQRHPDPVRALIEGARVKISDQEEEPRPPVEDLQTLFQEVDLARLKAILYRDSEDPKQTEWLVMATVYFVSVLMVSKYRDLLDPPVHRAKQTPAKPPTSASRVVAQHALSKPAAWHGEPRGSLAAGSMYSDSDDDEATRAGTSLSVSVDVHSPASIRALPPSEPSSPSASSSESGSSSASKDADEGGDIAVSAPTAGRGPEVSSEATDETTGSSAQLSSLNGDRRASNSSSIDDARADGEPGEAALPTQPTGMSELSLSESTTSRDIHCVSVNAAQNASDESAAESATACSSGVKSSDDTTKSISSILLRSSSQSHEVIESGDHARTTKEGSAALCEGNLSTLAELPSTAFANRLALDEVSLSERLERALGTAAPVLKDILSEFSTFLGKRLIGSKGQELLNTGGLAALRDSHSAIELVMLLCSQEWQLSLQKHAGLAFIELVNEGRLLSHATRNHVVRVANEAEFILNKIRAEDVQKHAAFGALCAQNMHRLKQEERTCDHLISSVRHRDSVMARKIIAKANAIYWCTGALEEEQSFGIRTFWKLDAWEDDSRRRRRLVPNLLGSTHPEATLRAALEQGAAEEAVADAREDVLAYIASQKRMLGISAVLRRADSLDTSFLPEEGAPADDSAAGTDASADTTSDPVVLSTACKLICLGNDFVGTLSVSRSEVFFEVDEENPHNKKIDSKVLAYADHLHGRWSFSDIYAVFGRKYLLQNTALEIFLSNRSSVMFAFPTQRVVKQIVGLLPCVGIGSKYGLPHTRQVSLMSPMQIFKMSDMVQKWRRREITNFDYLMFLNTVAGRTYCDINQYPVFPWVLVNYDSDDIDLSLASNYRDLSKPIGALNPDRKAYFDERYEAWDSSNGVPPFHYGTHYSAAAAVLGWLLRVEPYATTYLSLQGGKFDYPNRVFSSVLGAWKSCQSDTADVKEVIPEFYFLPEMFINSNGFKMGKLDDGSPLDDVILPPWAKNADDFVRICREALESEIVSCQLHEWIDLIFGYKQRGPEAARATNVFYYLSYEGNIDLESIKDTALREAVENQIRFFGQTPAQLLTEPHPPRGPALQLTQRLFAPVRAEVSMILKFLTNSPTVHLSANTSSHTSSPAVVSIFQNRTFAANKWIGNGPPDVSPTTAEPTAVSRSEPGFVKDRELAAGVALPLALDPVLLAPNPHLRRNLGENFDERLQLSRQHFAVTPDNRSLLACGFCDSSFRVFSIDTGKVTQVIFGHFDAVTCLSLSEVNTYRDCYIVTGSRDCTCMIWQWSGTQQRIINSDPTVQVSHSNLVPMSTLSGHLSDVVCCQVSAELGLVVSASSDGACLMHSLGGDVLRSLLDRQCGFSPTPLRQEDGYESAAATIRSLVISREGYILILRGGAELCLFSLSGRFLMRRQLSDPVKCMTLSGDGQYLLTGAENGVLSLLRTHDLSALYAYTSCNGAIHDLAVSHDQRYVMAGLGTGSIVVYNVDFTRWSTDYQVRYQR